MDRPLNQATILTEHRTVRPSMFTVMVAVPALTAVIIPSADTVALVAADDVYLAAVLVASDGNTTGKS